MRASYRNERRTPLVLDVEAVFFDIILDSFREQVANAASFPRAAAQVRAGDFQTGDGEKCHAFQEVRRHDFAQPVQVETRTRRGDKQALVGQDMRFVPREYLQDGIGPCDEVQRLERRQ